MRLQRSPPPFQARWPFQTDPTAIGS